MIGTKESEKEIVTLGKRFNLVTSKTSLLVLETVDQYLRYLILPPVTLPEIRKQYLLLEQQTKQTKEKAYQQKMSNTKLIWDRFFNLLVNTQFPNNSVFQVNHQFNFEKSEEK